MTALPGQAEFKASVLSKPVEGGSGFAFSSIPDILDELRNGRMIVLVDAPDRENEGDLVIPAQMATPEAINFMAKYGRGLVCLTLTRARAASLGLDAMVKQNKSRNTTAFTQSIEAKCGISTGISAGDRARTIATAVDSAKGSDDLVSPGHVFPLVARDGGVLIRAGHTEASVDLALLAGLTPAAVICEIMSEDGRMARVPELGRFAEKHRLKACTIEDLIAYRLRSETLIHKKSSKSVNTRWGTFEATVFVSSVDGSEHVAFVKGDLATTDPVLVRVHVERPLQDIFVESDGSVRPTLSDALCAIASEGRGVVVVVGGRQAPRYSDSLLRVDGGWPSCEVETGIGSQILKSLGVSEMVVLKSHVPTRFRGIEAYGLRITEMRGFS